MADEVKKKDESINDHILYNLLVHAEWNLDGEVLVGALIFCEHFSAYYCYQVSFVRLNCLRRLKSCLRFLW